MHTLGSYAHTSTPAYILSACFLVSSPLGFASPAQAAAEAALRLQQQQRIDAVARTVRRVDGTKPTSDAVARLIASDALRKAEGKPVNTMRAVPPFWQLAFLSAAFATGGYIIDSNDTLNGSGVVTAWSFSYLLFRTVPTFRKLPHNPAAMALTVAVSTLGLGVHGSYYFDRNNWRSDIPLFEKQDSQTYLPPYALPRAFDGSTTLQDLKSTPAMNNDAARAAVFLRRKEHS